MTTTEESEKKRLEDLFLELSKSEQYDKISQLFGENVCLSFVDINCANPSTKAVAIAKALNKKETTLATKKKKKRDGVTTPPPPPVAPEIQQLLEQELALAIAMDNAIKMHESRVQPHDFTYLSMSPAPTVSSLVEVVEKRDRNPPEQFSTLPVCYFLHDILPREAKKTHIHM